jgi:asparagine synthase (glutamine-hydrolysing)
MNAGLTHRGPDDSGQYDTENCSIAMRRLSIIDLQGGHQPLANEAGLLTIVFNGEIYNFQQLRRKLEQSGRHLFRTKSDTEVILHLYEDEGAHTPALLNGMFAFCIFDQRDQSLFIARDRFGEKPLYYAVLNGQLGFSSELPSLLRWQQVRRKINYTALAHLLRFGFVPQPLTLFEGLFQLPPGHYLHWREQNVKLGRYFAPMYAPDSRLADERTAVEALQKAIMSAVASQMVADVPIGAFLSGGIDSSTVVAAMQRQSSRPVKTFTARFEYSAYDESHIARAVAQHLGTEHHEFVITDAGFHPDDMWRVINHFGQPFLDSSAIPTYMISKQIRGHATVALSGDGGDEVFAGYRFFSEALTVDRLARLPSPALTAGKTVMNSITRLPLFRRHSVIRKARRAFEIAELPETIRPAYMETLFNSDEIADLVSPASPVDSVCDLDSYARGIFDDVGDASRLRQLMHYATVYRLPEDMLAKVDRMSMATSLEVRCPLLSEEVSSLAMKLPDRLLIRRNTRKYLLRQAGRQWLPNVVYSHPKMGFTIPLHTFLNTHYGELCNRYLIHSRAPLIRDMFRKDALQTIVHRAYSVKRSNAETSVHRSSHQLWGLLQLGAWAEAFSVTG